MDDRASSVKQPAVADFGRTRWSMVAGVRSGSEEEARTSLAELCRRYWVPVYAYIRCCGQPPKRAAILVQAFLSRVVAEIRDGDPAAEGGFRVFLQNRLDCFLTINWDNLESASLRPELTAPWPLAEIEERQQREFLPQATPTQVFQRSFALELLALGLQLLRQEAERGGRGDVFDYVRPYLTKEPGPGEYAELAARLKSSPLATVIAVKRLRQRYQQLIDSQLAQTVGNPEAFEAERSALMAMLSGSPSA